MELLILMMKPRSMQKLTAFKAGLQSDGTIYQLLKDKSDENLQKLESAFGSSIDTRDLDDSQIELLETASASIQEGLNIIYDKDLTKEEIDQLQKDSKALKEFKDEDGNTIEMDDNFKAVMKNIREKADSGEITAEQMKNLATAELLNMTQDYVTSGAPAGQEQLKLTEDEQEAKDAAEKTVTDAVTSLFSTVGDEMTADELEHVLALGKAAIKTAQSLNTSEKVQIDNDIKEFEKMSEDLGIEVSAEVKARMYMNARKFKPAVTNNASGVTQTVADTAVNSNLSKDSDAFIGNLDSTYVINGEKMYFETDAKDPYLFTIELRNRPSKEVLIVDDNGNAVLDEQGNKTYNTVIIPDEKDHDEALKDSNTTTP